MAQIHLGRISPLRLTKTTSSVIKPSKHSRSPLLTAFIHAACTSRISCSLFSVIRGAAASIAATSIFLIVIIASNARLAAAGSGSVIAFVSAIGVICQDKPHLSLHQPHALSSPPLPTIAFQ